MSEPVEARCPTCFRRERWLANGEHLVEQEGGRRRAPEPAWLATWEALRAWREGGPAVVGTCAACGQPLVSDSPGAPALAGWRLHTPGGELVLGEWITGPDGPLELAAADAFVRAQARVGLARRAARELPTLPFLAIVLVGVALIAAMWASGASFFFTFIWQGMQTGGFTGSPGGGLTLPP